MRCETQLKTLEQNACFSSLLYKDIYSIVLLTKSQRYMMNWLHNLTMIINMEPETRSIGFRTVT